MFQGSVLLLKAGDLVRLPMPGVFSTIQEESLEGKVQVVAETKQGDIVAVVDCIDDITYTVVFDKKEVL